MAFSSSSSAARQRARADILADVQDRRGTSGRHLLAAIHRARRRHTPRWHAPESVLTETTSQGREYYDDTDDYHGYTAQPAEDVWGIEMGQGDDIGGLRHPSFRLREGYFDDWKQTVEVYYVSESNPSVRLPNYSTSDLRAVEVCIYRQRENGALVELAQRRQVFSYYPPTN